MTRYLTINKDEKERAKRVAGRLEDGSPAIAYDGKLRLWYAKEGADLSKVSEWIPKQETNQDTADAVTSFTDHLVNSGLVVEGQAIMDGKRHRVQTILDKKGQKSGEYAGYLNQDIPGGWHIDYRASEDTISWKHGSSQKYSVEKALANRALAEQRKLKSELDAKKKYDRVAAEAQKSYSNLSRSDSSESYLKNKGVSATIGIKSNGNGGIVIPLRDTEGSIRTYQTIHENGFKSLLKDGEKQGNYFVVGATDVRGRDEIYYAEGFSTAASIHQATNKPVVMTVDGGNLPKVAEKLFAQNPNAKHVFFADDDRDLVTNGKPDNKGVVKATEAANLSGGLVVIPKFKTPTKELTDFNDLHSAEGLDVVALQIKEAIKKREIMAESQNDNNTESIEGTAIDGESKNVNLENANETALSLEEKKALYEKGLAKYQRAYSKTIELRSEFARKPGYVRQKQPDELAYQGAKKTFGEFKPSDKKYMAGNDNQGRGVDVKMPDGSTDNIPNQLSLYNKVVAFNKARGKFYDEKHIKATSPSDYQRLQSISNALEDAKKEVLNSAEDRSHALTELSKLEKEVVSGDKPSDYSKPDNVRTTVEPKTQSSNSTHSPPTSNSDNEVSTDDTDIKPKSDNPHEALFNRYRVQDTNKGAVFYWKETDKEAFKDDGKRLSTTSENEAVAESIVEVADAKGWTSMKVKGTDKFKRQVWLQAQARGIDVKGYKPTKQDLSELGEVKKKLDKENSAEKVSSENSIEDTSSKQTSSNNSSDKQEIGLSPKNSKPPIADTQNNKANYERLALLSADKSVTKTERTLADGQSTVSVNYDNDGKNETVTFRVDKNTKLATPSIYKNNDNKESTEFASNSNPHDLAIGNKIEERLSSLVDRQNESSAEKPNQLDQGSIDSDSAQRDRRKELEQAFNSLSQREAVRKHPELLEVYKLDAAANELAEKRIDNESSRSAFVAAVRERSFDELSQDKALPVVPKELPQKSNDNEPTQNQQQDPER